MNPNLAKLQPYPFEKLRLLFKDIVPDPRYAAINLGIGEPKHPTPKFIRQALAQNLAGLASYPHVVENRRPYAQKFAAVLPLLQAPLVTSVPEGGFLWVRARGLGGSGWQSARR